MKNLKFINTCTMTATWFYLVLIMGRRVKSTLKPNRAAGAR